MVYLDNNNEKQNVFIPRMTVNTQNYTPSTGGGEGYATEEWVESQGYITPSNLKTINGESLVGSGNIVIEGGGEGDVRVRSYHLGYQTDESFISMTIEQYIDIWDWFTVKPYDLPVIWYGIKKDDGYRNIIKAIPIVEADKITLYGKDVKIVWDTLNSFMENGVRYIKEEILPIDEECIVLKPLDNYTITVYDLDTNEQLSKEYYTYKSNTAAKAFNGDAMKKIKAGLVKSLVVPIPSKNNVFEYDYVNRKRTIRPQFVYVPLAFGWDYAGGYGYATGVSKYWYEGNLEYNYIAIDMDADGNVIKYEIQSLDGIKAIVFDLNNPDKNVAYDAWLSGTLLYGDYQFEDENSTIAKFPISVSAGKGDSLILWGKIDRTRSIEVVWNNIYDDSAPTITVYED